MKLPARLAEGALGLSGIVAFLALWEAVARIRNDRLVLVPPTDVLARAWTTLQTADYWMHWRVSMTEYAIGMSLAAVTGVLAGLLLGQLPWLRRAVDPVLAAFYSTPTVALAPIFILWFGIGLESKVMIVWYVAVLPIIVVTATGFANVDPAYVDVARVFRTPRWRMFAEVLVPAAMPSVIGGIRIGSGVGLIGVILGEFFGSQAGLGYLVLYATNRFDLALMLLGVISLAVVGMVIAAALKVLERRWAG
jgi:ABC-type nitrate/sulfonate/bicarbonate transport system permease component